MGGKVDNRCLSCLIMKHPGTLPKDQARVFEEDPCSLMKHYLAVRIDSTEDDPCVDQWNIDAIIFPNFRWWRMPPSPTQPLNVVMECRFTGYGLCVYRRRFDTTVVPHIEN